MHTAIDTLMKEHRVIEQVMTSLEGYARAARNGGSADRSTVHKYAEFFQNFADRCHHGKEEDRLFKTMGAYGFPADQGPVAVMLADHEYGRERVRALARIGSGSGPLTADERAALHENATEFISMLRAHIMKEDNILYPMALRAIPPAEMDALGKSFDAFEREVMGAGEHERFHRLADELCASSGPKTTCCHHG
ncbi:MAG: hemerythrin domain-containing protein [Acidobacteriota bacterium]